MAEQSQHNIHLFTPGKAKTSATNIDFAVVYEQHRLAIYRYILTRIWHVDDAHDMTAQVFLKAYRNLASYRHEAHIIAWLIGIARHQIIDYYRGQKPDVSLADIPDLPAQEPSLEVSIEHKHQMKRVSEALTTLSDDRREAIAMRLFAGLTNPEIAKIMGKSTDAVAMLVYRGVQDLQGRLSEEENV